MQDIAQAMQHPCEVKAHLLLWEDEHGTHSLDTTLKTSGSKLTLYPEPRGAFLGRLHHGLELPVLLRVSITTVKHHQLSKERVYVIA